MAGITCQTLNREINRELTTPKRAFSLAIQAGKLITKPHIPLTDKTRAHRILRGGTMLVRDRASPRSSSMAICRTRSRNSPRGVGDTSRDKRWDNSVIGRPSLARSYAFIEEELEAPPVVRRCSPRPEPCRRANLNRGWRSYRFGGKGYVVASPCFWCLPDSRVTPE